MTALEGRYRRLLAVYPADHRHAYEREMLGVLMAGSRPGQRFPRLADAADLVRAGIGARLGGARHAAAWRDAAAVTSLVTALLLVVVNGAAVPFTVRMMIFGKDARDLLGPSAAIDTVRAGAWSLVVIAILAGRRHVAAALGLVGLMAEIGGFVARPPIDAVMAMDQAWAPVLITVGLASLFAALPGRRVTVVLGRRGLALIAAGVLLAVALLSGMFPVQATGFWLGTGRYGIPEPLLVVATGLVVAGAWHGSRRSVALLAPALVVPLGHVLLWNLPPKSYAMDVTLLLAVLIVLPIGTSAIAVAGFAGRERGEVKGP
jgi:hypothetical protein